jgi:hypothetical protein
VRLTLDFFFKQQIAIAEGFAFDAATQAEV